ncbi:MAG: sigma-70 family RNA polymerase sigma factor [Muribaculaceae bacterium]|nr:sigma-70 family RNA polymerase sigma factor [Muribaculaceae bacterium]
MDRREFEQLARGLRPRVLMTATRVLTDPEMAEDVAQETLLKLWSLRERLSDYQNVDGLAMVIARNKCLDILRQQNRVYRVPIEDVEAMSPELSPMEALIDTESDDEVSEILSMLPEGQQVVLRMKHIEGMEVEDIAQLTGCTPNAIRVTLSRARKRVKEIFNNRD